MCSITTVSHNLTRLNGNANATGMLRALARIVVGAEDIGQLDRQGLTEIKDGLTSYADQYKMAADPVTAAAIARVAAELATERR